MTEKSSIADGLIDDKEKDVRAVHRRGGRPVLPIPPLLGELYQNCIETGVKVAKGHEALMSFVVVPQMLRSCFHYIPQKELQVQLFAYNGALARRIREDILIDEMIPKHLEDKLTDKEIIRRYKDGLSNNPLHHVLNPHFSKDMYDVLSPFRSETNRQAFLNGLTGKGENGTLFDKKDMIVFSLENMEWQAAEADIDKTVRCDFLTVVRDHKEDICKLTQTVADLAVYLRDEGAPYWFKTGWKKVLKSLVRI